MLIPPTCRDDATSDSLSGIAEAVPLEGEVVGVLVDHDGSVHNLDRSIKADYVIRSVYCFHVTLFQSYLAEI